MINVIQMLTVDEGVKYRVYIDTKGNKTIGIGFNMDDPNARDVWTQADILESFDNVYNGAVTLSIKSVGDLVNTCISNCKYDLKSILHDFDTYPIYVQLALIDLMFNMGRSVFNEFTTFISRIRIGNYDGAADDLTTTKWATELQNRSKRVIQLLRGDDSLYTGVNSITIGSST